MSGFPAPGHRHLERSCLPVGPIRVVGHRGSGGHQPDQLGGACDHHQFVQAGGRRRVDGPGGQWSAPQVGQKFVAGAVPAGCPAGGQDDRGDGHRPETTRSAMDRAIGVGERTGGTPRP